MPPGEAIEAASCSPDTSSSDEACLDARGDDMDMGELGAIEPVSSIPSPSLGCSSSLGSSSSLDASSASACLAAARRCRRARFLAPVHSPPSAPSTLKVMLPFISSVPGCITI